MRRPTDSREVLSHPRIVSASALLAWIAFLLLGSWYPFRLNDRTWSEAWNAWQSISLGSDHSTTDVALNLLIGIPLGFFGFTCVAGLHGARHVKLATLFSVVLGVGVFSSFLEISQHRFTYRIASSVDTIAQIVGACLGSSLAWGGGAFLFARTSEVLGFRTETWQRRLHALLDLYVAGYCIWMLMPFIPALSPSELAAKWRSGAIQLSPLAGWSQDPFTAIYTLLVCVFAAAPIGWWFQLSPYTRTLVRSAWLRGCWACTCVAALEVAQIFIETRTSAVDDLIWSAAGAAVGAVAAVHGERGRLTVFQSSRIWFLITVVYAIVYLAAAWAPFEFVDSSTRLLERGNKLFSDPVGWSEFGGNDYALGTNLLRTLLWSFVLGALAAIYVHFQSGTRHRLSWLTTICAVAFTAALSELGQVAIATSTPSLVGMCLRVIAATAPLFLVHTNLDLIDRSKQ